MYPQVSVLEPIAALTGVGPSAAWHCLSSLGSGLDSQRCHLCVSQLTHLHVEGARWQPQVGNLREGQGCWRQSPEYLVEWQCLLICDVTRGSGLESSKHLLRGLASLSPAALSPCLPPYLIGASNCAVSEVSGK